ncbi:MAG TPA: aspartate carbamoyltransferase [Marinilabiliales bacterium]|nr:MAG: aspartate carbamoyltransferase [Bacteroidetes bacterium GWA2_40_14]OFX62254.1 MAG: aspartate carbamoyltransferase [Bacteroidetes bacterium GWC2_40_13]OFX73810.1 MAG: aspartate carbamoyltransferase [Bacteroidetes bacterium GWD2_40_43]OFX89438.1 MAG: aspartate carbamoyltransferase [Bacteroidetes bacterium GWE2_40_63]OFY23264.1 MAG: aspartate carbamoyltransferase [Bacteroidetes bacterium GWF2_40_13]OFZ28127.1 MAG: aspartate carbamoyltransferase [Bacteroidetes bacterium RIFOXYC2_FULL_40_12
MKNKSLVSIDDYSKEDYIEILRVAAEFEKNPVQNILEGRVVATLFFEPSTRTRLSFESAVNRLGGRVIGFTDSSSSSVSKGESLKDTILTVSNYSDLIVMRHPLEGSARYASEVATVPVINAGDGANQHPTQCLLDLYSIQKTQGTLENLKISMVGDLKYGRTVHSLIMAMSYFNPTFIFIAPDELKMPEEYKLFLDKKGIKYEEHTELAENIKDSDILYMTRVQRERFADPLEYEKVKNVYILKNKMLDGTKDNLKILHPLPRVNEINTDVDTNHKAYYFPQALNGVFTRQAIMAKILGLK